MANLKSSKKRAKQAEVNRKRNLARKSAIKSAMRKVHESLQRGDDIVKTQNLLREVESQLARAKGKKVLHRKTAARKMSRIAKKVHTSKTAE